MTTLARVFVRGLAIEAQIGVHAYERGRRQRLVIDVEVELTGEPWRSIRATLDYQEVAAAARRLADEGHVGLVETFAWRLAASLAEHPLARRVRVRVEKPGALAPEALGAGAEVAIEVPTAAGE